MIKRFIIILLVFGGSFATVFSQVDSLELESDSTIVLKKQFYASFPTSFEFIDSTINSIHRYDVLFSENKFPTAMSNIGLPHKSILYTLKGNSQFFVGQENISSYFLTKDKIPFYKSHNAFSEASYGNGAEEQNYFDFSIANQISKTVYVGADVGIQAGKGTFKNQTVRNNQFQVLAKYNTLNQRYHISANFIRNRLKFGENGGIILDSNITNLSSINRRILNTNLTTARNELYSNTFILSQKFYLPKTDTNTVLKNQIYAFLNIESDKNDRVYFDEVNADFYGSTIYSNTETYDSISTASNSLEFGFSNFNSIKQSFGFKLSAEYDSRNYFNNFEVFNFNYLKPKAAIFIKTKRQTLSAMASYQILLNTDFTASNYGNNVIKLNSDYKLEFTENYKLNLKFDFNVFDEKISYFNTFSNYYRWQNNFDKSTEIRLYANLDLYGYQLNANIVNAHNLVYLDENVNPVQASSAVQYVQIGLDKNLKIWKFGLDANLSYQLSSKDYLRLPDFVARANFYINFSILKGALNLQPGIDVYAITSYYADAYNPNLMEFHLQNNELLKDQLHYDVYINFKIKQARVFVKYQNLNSKFGDFKYFMTPYNPIEDPGIKFGLIWRFVD
jgi:hypothetical protein